MRDYTVAKLVEPVMVRTVSRKLMIINNINFTTYFFINTILFDYKHGYLIIYIQLYTLELEYSE